MRRLVLLAALGPLALAACGSEPVRERQTGVLAAHVSRCAAGSEAKLGSATRAYAAVVPRRAVAYRAPGRGPFGTFGHLNQNRAVTVFGVLGEVVGARCGARWYHVQLPMRPNGATGYVRASDVEVGFVRTRIDVDLSRRQITLYRDGRAVLRTTAAVGSSATPTPVGRYYVNQRLIPADANGPFGPGAIGISAFSPVLTGWAQGGPIAIHGTNEPWTIGHAMSNGCLRVRNDVLRRLFAATPAGTPVRIHA